MTLRNAFRGEKRPDDTPRSGAGPDRRPAAPAEQGGRRPRTAPQQPRAAVHAPISSVERAHARAAEGGRVRKRRIAAVAAALAGVAVAAALCAVLGNALAAALLAEDDAPVEEAVAEGGGATPSEAVVLLSGEVPTVPSGDTSIPYLDIYEFCIVRGEDGAPVFAYHAPGSTTCVECFSFDGSPVGFALHGSTFYIVQNVGAVEAAEGASASGSSAGDGASSVSGERFEVVSCQYADGSVPAVLAEGEGSAESLSLDGSMLVVQLADGGEQRFEL